MTLEGVGFEQLGLGETSNDVSNCVFGEERVSSGKGRYLRRVLTLPSQVKGILHRGVHSLTSLRAVSVARITGEEDAVVGSEGFGKTLADVIACKRQGVSAKCDERRGWKTRTSEPLDQLGVESVGMKNGAGGSEDRLGGNLGAIEVLSGLDLSSTQPSVSDTIT